MVYNENAAALTWEIVNDNEDIGTWELVYAVEERFITYKGTGLEEFLSAARKLSNNINVIFVKRIRWFVHLAKNHFSFENRQFFANNDYEFFFIEIDDNVELRSWDQFWDKIDDAQEFLERLNTCRTYLNHGEGGKLRKNKASLKDHYKYTLAKEMWKDVCNQYYLYYIWASNYCKELAPQDDDEFEWMSTLDKGSFYYCNPNSFNRVTTQIHCYDISSSHLGLLYRKKFPLNHFTKTEDYKEIQEIIKKDFYCYYGLFRFQGLKYRDREEKFKIDLARFGQRIENTTNGWDLLLTNVDIKWFKEMFEWDSCICGFLFYTQQKELCQDYAKMFIDLYEYKKAQKKGTFAKEIHKFRAELPFGQPIKSPVYPTKVVYIKEENDFRIVDNDEKTLEQIKFDLSKRGIPMYVSLWVAAYSRLEFFTMVNRIGFDKVIYGDTDSVKFVGEEGIEIIKEYNKGIDKEVEIITKKRHLIVNNDFGRWLDEGDLIAIKPIGIKWYITLKEDNSVEIKASGADTKKLNEWANSILNPLHSFNRDMEVFGMFHLISVSRENNKAIVFAYQNKMDSKIKKEISKQGTTLFSYLEDLQEVS